MYSFQCFYLRVLPPASLPTAAALPTKNINLMKEYMTDWTLLGWPGKVRYLWNSFIHSFIHVIKILRARVSNLGTSMSRPYDKGLCAGRLPGRWSQEAREENEEWEQGREGKETTKHEAMGKFWLQTGAELPETLWKTTYAVTQKHPTRDWGGCAI